MNVPPLVEAMARWLSRLAFGGSIERDEDPAAQFETIVIAYCLVGGLIAVVLFIFTAAIGYFASEQVTLSSKVGDIIAASNVVCTENLIRVDAVMESRKLTE
jgi:hypothetical protein